jgi:hypothetical protein
VCSNATVRYSYSQSILAHQWVAIQLHEWP